MPSAEQVTSAAIAKLEIAPQSEPKSVENTQKEIQQPNALDQNEKSVPAIQQVITIIANKVRNLEKRKNKLDGYIKEEESGKELSSEQEKAVAKYDEVVQQLSLSKEFCKQFQLIATAASKDAKREARKNLFSRQFQETAKVREVLMIQELLQRLKDDGIRSDFINERNGACRINKAEMEFIEKFAQHAVPTRPNFSNEPSFSNSAKTSADHFSFLIDGRNRQFLDTGLTYEKARELLNRIQSCGYWEKDVKIVEVTEESRAANDTPSTEDLEGKDEKSDAGEDAQSVAAPAPAQVPTPSFNGNVNNMAVQQQQHHQQRLQQAPSARVPQQQQQTPLPAPTNVSSNMKTTVTAVENAYFNQMKYSQPQGQLLSNALPITPSQNDFGTNFSFLQDSELDSPAAQGSQQQKMSVNVIQPEQSPVQHQHHVQPSMNTQAFKNANFHPQSQIAAGQMTSYPPGLKPQPLQNSVSHIPVNYQASTQQQLNQASAAPSSQVPPSHMIPKQQPVNGGGNQNPGYGAPSQTPPINQQQQQQSSRPAYPAVVPKAQYQQQLPNSNAQNLSKTVDPSMAQKLDGAVDASKANDAARMDKEDYQQQPQIDTWTNETAAQSGGNFTSRSAGGFNRNNSRSTGATGTGGAKFNNYRNPQQPRNFNENGSGDSPRDGSNAAGTFFRNNERYNGSAPTGGARFENRGGAGGNFKPREGNYRAGSGRLAGSASAAAAHGSSNPVQRK